MSVFDDYRRAWREAVDNFWRELEADGPEGESRAAFREMGTARSRLEELDAVIGETRQRLDDESTQVEVCIRRERMARSIGDEETARVAAEYCERHRERVEVFGRKLDALEAERRLCVRDLRDMEKALQDGRIAAARSGIEDLDRHPRESEFRNLEDSARGRTAEERLEELKRRMGKRESGSAEDRS